MRRQPERSHKSIACVADAQQARCSASSSSPTPVRSHNYTVATYDAFSALPHSYDRLFSLARSASLFFTLPWYRNFSASVLASNEHLRIFGVETAAGTAAALLAMHYRESTAPPFGLKRLQALSNYYTSLFGPLLEPGTADMQHILHLLAGAIAGDEMDWDVVDLHPLAVDSPVFSGLVSALRDAGLLVQSYFCFGNWYLPVNNQSFDEYFGTRSSRLSKTAKRQRRILQASGRFRFELFSDIERLDQAIADYNAVYNSSWKVPEPYPTFIPGLIRTCAEQGWLRLGIAYLDGQPAAAQLWTVVDGQASIYKMAYDGRFAKESVGTVLSSLLMEHVIEVDKVRVVDYLSGDDVYKRDWMSHRRERWGIIAFNPRTPHGLLAASRHIGGRAARRAVDAVRRFAGTWRS